MSLPTVQLERLESGRRWRLGPGAIIGRMPAAALRLDEPAVSEAHALVSLRGEGLHLLALRGAFRVEGLDEDGDDVELEEGLQVRLAPGVTLVVTELVLPQTVLALREPETGLHELHAPTYSVFLRPRFDLVPGLHAGAAATLWSDGEGWWVRVDGDRARRLRAGGALPDPLGPLTVVDQPVGTLSVASTVAGGRDGMVLVGRYLTCHLQRPGRRTVVLDGQPGRILSELVRMGAPVEWAVLAGELWPTVDPVGERDRLRRSFDRVMRRLRLKLKEHGVREDLVRPDGQGNYELVLQVGDRLVDEA